MAQRASRKNSDDARILAVATARLADERNAEDILVLDLRTISDITDYFVIATGTSDRQMRSLAEELKLMGAKLGRKLWKSAGMDAGDWIVMDFVDVVVHLFNQPLRAYYDLELIWGEAPQVDWQREKRD